MGKITKALLTAVVVIGLYVVALYLPNITSTIALALGVVAFLISLYLDRDYRFFRIATVALFMLGLQKIIPHLAKFNLEINPSSVLLKLNSDQTSTAVSDVSLVIIVIISLILDFLREKNLISFNEKTAKLLIWGLAIAVIGLSVPSTLFSHNIFTFNTYNVADGGTVINYPTEKEYAKENQASLENIEKLLKSTIDPKERSRLEAEKKALDKKLFNTKKALQEAMQLHKESLGVIKKINSELPSEQLAKAEKLLQGSADIRIAEKAFDEVVKVGAGPVAQAAFQSGKIAQGRVDYKKAIKQYTKAIVLDEDNPEYLFVAGQMATIIADYDLAQEWLEHLKTIREKEKKNDANLASALHEVATLYKYQGKYEEAERLYQRSLTIIEKAQGSDSSSIANVLEGLAGLYEKLGKYEESESLYQRSLTITEKALGSDSSSVATTLNNLAVLYNTLGKHEEAEQLYQRILTIREKALESHHPSVAKMLNNLAMTYGRLGKYEEAEPLYQRSLTITEKALGSEHPFVATILNNLAGLYFNQGKYEEAEQLLQRTLMIKEKALGSNHQEVAITLNNLAALYKEQGKYEEAEPLYQRSLTIRENTLGSDHLSVVLILTNFAGLYKVQGKYEEAESLYKRAFITLEKLFPDGHPDFTGIKGNYDDIKKKIAEKND